MAGPEQLQLLRHLDEKQIIANCAVPVLRRLAGNLRCMAQLGTPDGNMATFRIKTREEAGDLFNRVDMPLQSYCAEIGKVLLSWLPAGDREAYLATGPFPALTTRTTTASATLTRELA